MNRQNPTPWWGWLLPLPLVWWASAGLAMRWDAAAGLAGMLAAVNDFLAQYDQVAKMGDINDIVGMIPGASRLKGGAKKIDEKELAKNRAIILSMTKQEREHPKILNYSRRKRIAQGSGTQVQDVNRLIKQFEQSRDLMKKMAKSKRLPF